LTEDLSNNKTTTRRNALKLGGAAALALAATAGLGATHTKAAGSGFTVDIFDPPARVIDTRGHAKIGIGAEVVLGTFPAGGGFFSDSYYGMIANLTAARWNGPGWLSVRKNGTAFIPATVAVNFWGESRLWSNLIIVRFGDPTVGGMASDGKIIVRNGGAPTNFIIDLIGFLGPDQ